MCVRAGVWGGICSEIHAYMCVFLCVWLWYQTLRWRDVCVISDIMLKRCVCDIMLKRCVCVCVCDIMLKRCVCVISDIMLQRCVYVCVLSLGSPGFYSTSMTFQTENGFHYNPKNPLAKCQLNLPSDELAKMFQPLDLEDKAVINAG